MAPAAPRLRPKSLEFSTEDMVSNSAAFKSQWRMAVKANPTEAGRRLERRRRIRPELRCRVCGLQGGAVLGVKLRRGAGVMEAGGLTSVLAQKGALNSRTLRA
jgi:hypothetical protein